MKHFFLSLPPAAAMGLFLLAAVSGCDTSLGPFAEEPRYYSLHGYLDPARDTQYVRVEALQDDPLVGGTSDSLDARAFLEEVESGRRVEMQRRALPFEQGYYFSTAMDLRLGTTYRLTVRRSDGVTSTAETTVPDGFPPPLQTPRIQIIRPRCSAQETQPPAAFMLQDIERLVAAEATYYGSPLPSGQLSEKFSHLNDTSTTAAGRLRIRIEWDEDVGTCARNVDSLKVQIAEGAEGWPEYARLGQQGGLGDVLSNVENGVGYVGGAFSRTFDVPINRRQ